MAHEGEPKTRSERLFDAYLKNRSLSHEYEAEAHGVRPDFWVHAPGGLVVCEVTSRRAPKDAPSMGFLDPYESLRRAFTRKTRQGVAAVERKLPYVLVLHQEAGDSRPLDEISVPGAMLGNVSVTFPVGPGAPEKPPERVIFGRDRRMQPSQNTRFSVVAAIREFNPTAGPMQRELGRRLAKVQDTAQGVEIAVATVKEFTSRGDFSPDARAVRLDVFHNPFATAPLPLEAFGGPNDNQWGIVNSETATYDLAAQGVAVGSLRSET